MSLKVVLAWFFSLVLDRVAVECTAKRSVSPYIRLQTDLVFTAHMNRHHFHLSLSSSESYVVTILSDRLAPCLGIDRAEDLGDSYLRIAAYSAFVKLESSGGVIEAPASGYLLRSVVDGASGIGPDVIISKNALEDCRIAAQLRVNELTQ